MTLTDHESLGDAPIASATVRKRRFRRLGVGGALVGLALVLAGCNNVSTYFAFRGATTQGRTEYGLWTWTFLLGVAVAIIVWALIFWAVFRYRKRDDKIPRQFHENVPIEIIYTIVPVILVGILFWGTVVAENKIDYVKKNPNEIVHVLAYRWGWQFNYLAPDGKSQHVTVQTNSTAKTLASNAFSPEYPQLVLPAHSTIRIVLSSADVIHDFYVPAFNFGRYAQPGYANTFDFTTMGTGRYRGQCSEYCGLYHSEMIFSVKVVPQATFSSWLTAHQT